MSTQFPIGLPTSGKTRTCIQAIQSLIAQRPDAKASVIARDRLRANYFRSRLAAAGGAINVRIETFRDLYHEIIELWQTIGKMVHKASQRWRFPEDPGLTSLLDVVARESGVVSETQLGYATQEADQFLARFYAHSLWQMIDRSGANLHEGPYSLARSESAIEVGYIDLLYREEERAGGWSIVDFKTDTIQSEAELALLVDRYTRQTQRYTRAVRSLLGPVDAVYLCFLDACGQVAVVEV